ncbi:MAG: Radical domain protein [Anaerocolumna sp.]|jgi:MoaA/NifB/PqqE/SkfB family radical SAM enzyme|nr:Radical domain protein [Anaerocolumna sp.]
MSLSWGQLSGQLVENSLKKRIPFIGEFELTPRCNLHCKMCYVCQDSSNKKIMKEERTAKEWIRLAYEARDAGMLFLLLTGGEVFLRTDFKNIYEELSKMGLFITLFTNGTMITPEIASWLGRIAPSQVEITLYGASSETYGRVCGNPDGFLRTMRGLKLLLDQSINVQIKTTIIKENMEDYDRLVEIADSFGLNLGVVNYVAPRRDGNRHSPIQERLSPIELATFEEKVSMKEFTEQTNLLSDKLSELQSDTILSHSKDIAKYKKQQDLLIKDYYTDNFPCNSGKNSFWVTWDGKMVPCTFMDSPATYPFEKGFQTAWEELKKSCNLVPVCTTCQECSLNEYCQSCPATLRMETGSFTEPAPYLCKLAQERQMNADKYMKYGGIFNEGICETNI